MLLLLELVMLLLRRLLLLLVAAQTGNVHCTAGASVGRRIGAQRRRCVQ